MMDSGRVGLECDRPRFDRDMRSRIDVLQVMGTFVIATRFSLALPETFRL